MGYETVANHLGRCVNTVTPFRVDVPQSVLDDLSERLARTRMTAGDGRPGDWSRGTDTTYLMQLLTYWRDSFDWRAQERMLNDLPHFTLDSSSGPIHFVHVRSRHPDATPLVLTHGWPWTFHDWAKVIAPLTDPTSYGGTEHDAFHVVIPSIPGFIFSTPSTVSPPTWWETADVWADLMQVLGYRHFGAVGGDWGAWITAQLGHKYPERLLGIHLFDAARLDMWGSDRPWDPFESTRAALTPLQRQAFLSFERKAASHVAVQVLDPRTLAHGLNDSPAGLCSWLLERRRAWSDCHDDVESCFSKDELLTGITLYWATSSIGSSLHIYPSAVERPWTPSNSGPRVVHAPTALSSFAHHSRPAGAWAESYYDLRIRREHPRGGHFAPAEVPDVVVDDIRASFSLFRDRPSEALTL